MIPLPASGPFFVTIAGRKRFCFVHVPATLAVRGSILAVHAFAEELNKTRAAVASGARALAAAGFVVLQIDLLGCGDSAGDLADASWPQWQDDLREAWSWLDARCTGQRWLWGTRIGALMAEQFAATCLPRADGLLLWQPVVNGAQHLGQFLRLKTVGNLLRQSAVAAVAASGPSGVVSAPSRAVEQSPRAELAAGRAVEIAGYRLTPALADSIEAARLGAVANVAGRVLWFEVSTPRSDDGEMPALSPIALRVADRWRASGHTVDQISVDGQPFWQTVEITRCDPLVAATIAGLA